MTTFSASSSASSSAGVIVQKVNPSSRDERGLVVCVVWKPNEQFPRKVRVLRIRAERPALHALRRAGHCLHERACELVQARCKGRASRVLHERPDVRHVPFDIHLRQDDDAHPPVRCPVKHVLLFVFKELKPRSWVRALREPGNSHKEELQPGNECEKSEH